jgi:hypothetical protein
MDQLISIAGALLILAAYAGNQSGVLTRHPRLYGAMNFVGGVMLTAIALQASQWGFALLEGAWAALSVPSLIARPAPRRTIR